MTGVEIGVGIMDIWVVYAQQRDHSGDPEMLAAYDGPNADRSAAALVELINRAGTFRNIVLARVPLWPLLKEDS